MRRIGLVVGCALLSQTVWAGEPAAVAMGPFSFIPTASISTGHDSNIFNQPSNEESSIITKLKPSLQWLAQTDANTFAFTYSGDYANYHTSGDDNYDDHSISADANLEMNSRNRFTLSANAEFLHDDRGTGSSEGGAAQTRDEPDEYRQDSLFGEWDFGAEGARFGARLTASDVDIEYGNNRIETQFRDRDETTVTARLYGRVMPKSRFFIEIEQEDISYDTIPISGNKLDSDQQAASIGIEWELTAQTSGSVQFGRTEKDFDSATLSDADINSWEVEVSWAPRTYSNVLFASSRAPIETNGTGNFIDSRSHSLSWQHEWSSQFGSTVLFGVGSDDFDGSPRSDDLTSYALSLSYELDRWASVTAQYAYEDKDSNDPVFDYDKSIVTLSLDVSL